MLTPLDKQLPHLVSLTLLQTAVRPVPELRIVETMPEYVSFPNSYSSHYSITYDKYFTMLQNACIRYDESLKQKPSSTTRAVYLHGVGETSGIDGYDMDYVEEEFAPDGIETLFDDFYNINTTNLKGDPQVKSLIPRTPKCKPKPQSTSSKPRYNGTVYLPKHIYDMLSEKVEKKLGKYNKEKKAKYQLSNSRMAKAHMQDHGDGDPPDTLDLGLTSTMLKHLIPCRTLILRTNRLTQRILCKNDLILPYLQALCFFLWMSSRHGCQW